MLLVLLFERKYSSIVGIQIYNLSFKGDLENEIRKEIKDQEHLPHPGIPHLLLFKRRQNHQHENGRDERR